MNKPIFIRHYLFRLLFPLIWGVMLYILILLVFSETAALTENFSPYELLLILLISYGCFEFLQWYNKFFTSKFLVKYRFALWIALFALSLIIIVILCYSILFFYLTFLLHISIYDMEINTILYLFLLSATIFNIMYYTLIVIAQQQSLLMQDETRIIRRYQSEIEYANKMFHAPLLFRSLEIINEAAHKNPSEADLIVTKLAAIYRFNNHSPANETVALEEEIAAAKNLIDILSFKNPNAIQLHFSPMNLIEYDIPATCLLSYIEAISETYILSPSAPLILTIDCQQNRILFKHNVLHEKIMRMSADEIIAAWKQQFAWLTQFEITTINTKTQIEHHIIIK